MFDHFSTPDKDISSLHHQLYHPATIDKRHPNAFTMEKFQYTSQDSPKSPPPCTTTSSPQPAAAGSIVQDIPDYWNCQPEIYRRPDPQPIMNHWARRGGIHVSWLHYCILILVIFSMGFVLTIWTAVALHRTDSMVGFVNNYPQPAVPPFIPQIQPNDPIWPAVNFKPNYVIEKARTVYFTTTVEVFETIPMDEAATSKSTSVGPTAPTPTSLSSTESISIIQFTSVAATDTSSTSMPIVSPTMTTIVTTKTSFSTQVPSTKPIRPTTRYFG